MLLKLFITFYLILLAMQYFLYYYLYNYIYYIFFIRFCESRNLYLFFFNFEKVLNQVHSLHFKGLFKFLMSD
jgi:hypothetical protein